MTSASAHSEPHEDGDLGLLCSLLCPISGSLLGIQQVLHKYLLSEQLAQRGATHTAVQIGSWHMGLGRAEAEPSGPSQAGGVEGPCIAYRC